jgi:tRNA threonylcarbamoyl adenosine modification protein YeaZ
MKILAFDTAADRCDACVFDSGTDEVLGASHLALGKGHAEFLLDIIGNALEKARTGYPELEAVAVTVGPGSFTGVRVGVSAARGFALALDIPAIGITTLEGIAAHAAAAEPEKPVLAVIDARRGEVYAQFFDPRGTPESEAFLSRPDRMAAMVGTSEIALAGSGAGLIAQAAGRQISVVHSLASPGVQTLARLAARKVPPYEKPRPFYLRAPDAKVQPGFAVARTTQ